MPLEVARTRKLLADFDFKQLFIDEVGWNHHDARLQIPIDSQSFSLTAVAEKCGMAAFLCGPGAGGRIPEYSIRRKIERQVAKTAHEHLIVFVDGNQTAQVWQWVRREQGRPAACREHTYHKGQPGDSLIQKLQALAVSLDEEESLTLPDVTGRARRAFDVERVTKRFYDRFKTEHATFLEFLDGIPNEDMERWYVSVMLNRLMFIYFIQKKGFLDGDADYLKNKLAQCRKELGKDHYYQDFLCPLFFEGFAKQKQDRSENARKLLGEVPYLNGGIFMPHQIEQFHGQTIRIPDKAFEKLFEFFDAYHWHLDERPLRQDNEINPDVLGYIFEKYINQKQMGAYYTKEDITGYISQNTVIPHIFDMTREKCKIAFEGEQSVWRLLKDDPDRYIYDAVRKGVTLSLPDNIAVGLDTSKRNLLERRNDWNRPAPPEYALPTEIWREVVARRKRYEEVKAKLAAGEVKSINDLITYNLDIRQFAQDVVEDCEGPELLRAIWHSIVGRIPRKSNGKFEAGISILDPTCGSGAFLFAALNILEPLYEACLERMQLFVDDLETSGQKHSPEKFADFKEILAEVDKHPNTKYFIYKSIIINNLFGVDIMEEAIEICKLRLFLKLVAQVDTVEKIEPLPDIDFNIRVGNTLVGFVNLDEVKHSMQGDFIKLQSLPIIEENAELADRAFRQFRYMQTRQDMNPREFAQAKSALEKKLKALESELNAHLAGEYGVIEGTKQAKEQYANWLASHKPFHWLIDFYGIIKNGGFNVIIGNPPYVEYSKIKNEYTIKNYKTEDCGNLYAFVLERCFGLLKLTGRFSMIVQSSIVCTDRMEKIQKLMLNSYDVYVANFDDRPAKLFTGMYHMKGAIVTCNPRSTVCVHSTEFKRWYEIYREHLFQTLEYASCSSIEPYPGHIPKISTPTDASILHKINCHNRLEEILHRGNNEVYCHRIASYFIKSVDFVPYFWNETDGQKKSEDYKVYTVHGKKLQQALMSILNSGIFYYFWHVYGDGYHCGKAHIEDFRATFPIDDNLMEYLCALSGKLANDYKNNSTRRETEYKTTGKVIYDEFYPKYSKPIIDEIDKVLAKHYGFTEEELDFIINYDIKYRMGTEIGGEDDE